MTVGTKLDRTASIINGITSLIFWIIVWIALQRQYDLGITRFLIVAIASVLGYNRLKVAVKNWPKKPKP